MAKKKESKQKKMNVRVDFTPMVDMMMLLITFFMLCTSLAKPQAMDIRMPAKQDIKEDSKEKSETKYTVTLYLASDNKLYSYAIPATSEFGKLESDSKSMTYFKEITYGVGEGSIRDALVNYIPYQDEKAPVQVIMDAKKKLDAWMVAQPKATKEVNDSIYEKALGMIRKGKIDVIANNTLDMNKYKEYIAQAQDPDFVEDPNKIPQQTIAVNIKPLDDCTYDNLVQVLDEMAICCIGVYRIAEVNRADLQLLYDAGVPGVEAPAPATAQAEE